MRCTHIVYLFTWVVKLGFGWVQGSSRSKFSRSPFDQARFSCYNRQQWVAKYRQLVARQPAALQIKANLSFTCPNPPFLIAKAEQAAREKDSCMRTYQFTVIIERQPEGEYLVSVPALPGCYTEGRTLEEAREMATDAIRAYCASLRKHGEPIPIEPGDEQFIGRLSVALELG